MAKAKKLPSGNWRVQLYIGKDAAGKNVYRSFTAPTRREAELAAAEYAMEMPAYSSASEMTLGEAIDKYIALKSNVLSPSTIRSYKTIRKTHLQRLMPIKLGRITKDIAQAEFNQLAATASPKTVRNVNGLFIAAIKMFMPGRQMQITMPQKEKPAVRIPSRSEVEKIYQYVKGSEMEIPFLLASQCGLRLSEVCALTYDNIGDGEITINKAVVRNEDNVYVYKTPKSYAGYRVVNCSPSLTDMLRKCCGADGRVVQLTYPQISGRWPFILRQLSIPHFRFHDLRHYYASEGLLLGVPPKYMAELMGHSSTDMIDKVYQHTFSDHKKEFSKALADKTTSLLQNE